MHGSRVRGRKREACFFRHGKGIHVRTDHQSGPRLFRAKEPEHSESGYAGPDIQSNPLQVFRHSSGGFSFRVAGFGDPMKLSADPDNPIPVLLNEFFDVDHVLTSKKKSAGAGPPAQGTISQFRLAAQRDVLAKEKARGQVQA
jgi:hypothetical protein